MSFWRITGSCVNVTTAAFRIRPESPTFTASELCLTARVAKVEERLTRAGAHHVVGSTADVVALLDECE
jgi:hypothetical protein